MTVDEKLQQLQLLSDGQITDADAKAGVGGVFSLTDPAKIDHFQHIAVEQSRLHIPILFAYDTIHGYRTVFPVPLGAASSFDPSVATADDTIAARETATVGIKQIYSPMVDVSHEPRWGRISEAAGEDPYLGSVFAAARVKAAQGDDYSAPDKVVTSVKHFAAYGQPEGGREYNTTDMSEQRLRNLYLPPFKAAIDAGADTAMCSFNAISGVPGCANPRPRPTSSRRSGASTASSRATTPPSPSCAPARRRTRTRARAATASPPTARTRRRPRSTPAPTPRWSARTSATSASSCWRSTGSRWRALDDAVRRILRVKFRAGLFEHPYVDQAKAVDPASFVHRRRPRRGARGGRQVDGPAQERRPRRCRSTPTKSTVVIGPLGDDKHDMLGPWWGQGKDDDAVSVFDGIKAQNPNTTFVQGCTIDDKDPPDNTPAGECGSDAGFAEAVAAANERRPDRPGARREPRAERRGRGPQRHRPPRAPAGADRPDRGARASRSSSCCSTAAR